MMKTNKFFYILSILLLLGFTGNSFSMFKSGFFKYCYRKFFGTKFSMQNKKLEVYERFKKLKDKKINFKYKICETMSPCGKYVVSGGDDRRVIVWDILENKEKCFYTHGDLVRLVSFSSDSKYVVSGGLDGEVKVWDILENKEKFSYNYDGYVKCVSFSPDSKYVVSVVDYRRVIVWDILENKEKYSYNHDNAIGCVSFGPDSKYVVFGGSCDKTVGVWDISEDKLKCSYCHDCWVIKCVSFSPDGRYVVSMGRDYGKVIVWDILENKEKFSYNYDGYVKCVSFSPDGDKIISVCCSGEAKVIKTSCEFYLNQNLYKLKKKQDKKIKKRLVKQKNKQHRCDVQVVCDSL